MSFSGVRGFAGMHSIVLEKIDFTHLILQFSWGDKYWENQTGMLAGILYRCNTWHSKKSKYEKRSYSKKGEIDRPVINKWSRFLPSTSHPRWHFSSITCLWPIIMVRWQLHWRRFHSLSWSDVITESVAVGPPWPALLPSYLIPHCWSPPSSWGRWSDAAKRKQARGDLVFLFLLKLCHVPPAPAQILFFSSSKEHKNTGLL